MSHTDKNCEVVIANMKLDLIQECYTNVMQRFLKCHTEMASSLQKCDEFQSGEGPQPRMLSGMHDADGVMQPSLTTY